MTKNNNSRYDWWDNGNNKGALVYTTASCLWHHYNNDIIIIYGCTYFVIFSSYSVTFVGMTIKSSHDSCQVTHFKHNTVELFLSHTVCLL